MKHNDLEHPNLETLAELAEWHDSDGSSPLSPEARRARHHLPECPDCSRELGEATRLILARAAGGAEDLLDASLRTAALRQGEEWARQTRTAAEPAKEPWWKIRLRPALLGAMATAAAVAFLVLGPNSPFQNSSDFRPQPLLQNAVNVASSQGPLLPETTESANPGTYRSGGDPDVEASLRRYLDTEWAQVPNERTPEAIDHALWLAAGEIAAGRLRAARLQLEGLSTVAPESAGSDSPAWAELENRRLLLVAVVDYRQSRMEAAERRLREVIRSDAQNEAARFNLGLLLGETGRPSEARAQIEPLEDSPNTWVRDRARAWQQGR